MQTLPPLPNCWYLTGATASGKTRLGLELAEKLDAEIVSLDSMAVYRGMNIGTAKPTAEDRKRIRHHMLDVVDPDQAFSLAEYLAAAHAIVRDIQQRGKEVLFVGGTPLYLKSLLRGVCGGPPADPEFRRAIEAEVARVGIGSLRERLAQVDPLSAAKLHPHDTRRMIRALEVYTITGQPISHHQLQFDDPNMDLAHRVFVLSWPRPKLHERIDHRVDRMFQIGILDEVRSLLDRCGTLGKTAIQGVGYREVIDHLRAEADLETTISRVKTRTRRFARRQETWFRGLPECQWVPLDEQLSDAAVIEQMLSAVK
ncbi:MAG: tRNA (adenosine(37)-N6)-dimethylallyltransferase MiaA [Pseudomonadales bacterium]